MDNLTLEQINVAVRTNLSGAEMISFVPYPYYDETREGYWERAFIATWSRPVRDNQPSPDGNGFVYATHRVHVNSEGKTACFDGHYDMKRNAALYDMLERAGIQAPEGYAIVRSK